MDSIVVGLFPTRGDAENASSRVVSEGAAQDDVVVQTLRDTAPVPDAMDPELKTLSLDPFFWFLGDLKDDYVGELVNGETAVCVMVHSAEEEEGTVATLRMFEPKRIDVVNPPAGRIPG